MSRTSASARGRKAAATRGFVVFTSIRDSGLGPGHILCCVGIGGDRLAPGSAKDEARYEPRNGDRLTVTPAAPAAKPDRGSWRQFSSRPPRRQTFKYNAIYRDRYEAGSPRAATVSTFRPRRFQVVPVAGP